MYTYIILPMLYYNRRRTTKQYGCNMELIKNENVNIECTNNNKNRTRDFGRTFFYRQTVIITAANKRKSPRRKRPRTVASVGEH